MPKTLEGYIGDQYGQPIEGVPATVTRVIDGAPVAFGASQPDGRWVFSDLDEAQEHFVTLLDAAGRAAVRGPWSGELREVWVRDRLNVAGKPLVIDPAVGNKLTWGAGGLFAAGIDLAETDDRYVNITGDTMTGLLRLRDSNPTDFVLAFDVTGQTAPRLAIQADGTHQWSDGTAFDTVLYRTAVGGGLTLDKNFTLDQASLRVRYNAATTETWLDGRSITMQGNADGNFTLASNSGGEISFVGGYVFIGAARSPSNRLLIGGDLQVFDKAYLDGQTFVEYKRVAASADAGNTIEFRTNGFFSIGGLTQAAADLRYEPLDTMYTKAESDARYLTPAAADALFLTPTEGNAAYSTAAHNHDAAYVNVSGDTMAQLTLSRATPGQTALIATYTGAAIPGFFMDTYGTMQWSDGVGAWDTTLARSSAGVLSLNTKPLVVSPTAGNVLTWDATGLYAPTGGGGGVDLATGDARWVNVTGDVMSGPLTLNSDLDGSVNPMLMLYKGGSWGGRISIYNSRGTVGSPALSVAGDEMGSFNWYARGNTLYGRAIVIDATVEAVNGPSNVIQSRAAFWTQNSAGGLVERMRFDSEGRIFINRLNTQGSIMTLGPQLIVQRNSTAHYETISAHGYATGGDHMWSAMTSRGTGAAPANLENGGAVLGIHGYAYNAGWRRAGAFELRVGGALGASWSPGEFRFLLTDNAGVEQQRLRVDANGRTWVNPLNLTPNGYTASPGLTIQTDDTAGSDTFMVNKAGTSGGIRVGYRQSRGTVATPSPTLVGDELGKITWYGRGNTAYAFAAEIKAEVDAANAPSNVMQGRLLFLTTAVGGGMTERLRIAADGTVLITGGAATPLVLRNTGANDNVQIRIRGNATGVDQWAIGNEVATGLVGRNFDIYDIVAGANRLRIGDSGQIGIGSKADGTSQSTFEIGNLSASQYALIIRAHSGHANAVAWFQAINGAGTACVLGANNLGPATGVQAGVGVAATAHHVSYVVPWYSAGGTFLGYMRLFSTTA